MRRNTVWLLLALPLSACDLDLTDLGVACNFRRNFDEFASVTGSDRVRVIAEAGHLRVEGRVGLTEVRIRGDACAEVGSDLNNVDLVVQHVGTTVRVLSLAPSAGAIRTRLDLVVEVPDWMLVEVEHEEGDVVVERVAGVDVFDDSGDIRIRDIAGDVLVLDGSGWVDVDDVTGSVVVEDDQSGDLTIRNVGDDVDIISDGSGNILVENIFGDFRVGFDSSGTISYRNVGGTVTIPR
jgi:hypothetical protein